MACHNRISENLEAKSPRKKILRVTVSLLVAFIIFGSIAPTSVDKALAESDTTKIEERSDSSSIDEEEESNDFNDKDEGGNSKGEENNDNNDRDDNTNTEDDSSINKIKSFDDKGPLLQIDESKDETADTNRPSDDLSSDTDKEIESDAFGTEEFKAEPSQKTIAKQEQIFQPPSFEDSDTSENIPAECSEGYSLKLVGQDITCIPEDNDNNKKANIEENTLNNDKRNSSSTSAYSAKDIVPADESSPPFIPLSDTGQNISKDNHDQGVQVRKTLNQSSPVTSLQLTDLGIEEGPVSSLGPLYGCDPQSYYPPGNRCFKLLREHCEPGMDHGIFLCNTHDDLEKLRNYCSGNEGKPECCFDDGLNRVDASYCDTTYGPPNTVLEGGARGHAPCAYRIQGTDEWTAIGTPGQQELVCAPSRAGGGWMGIGGDEFDPDHWGCEYTNNGFVPGCPGSFWETCNYGTKAVSNDPTCQAFKDNPTVNPYIPLGGQGGSGNPTYRFTL